MIFVTLLRVKWQHDWRLSSLEGFTALESQNHRLPI
jgi:hypothetical protein